MATICLFIHLGLDQAACKGHLQDCRLVWQEALLFRLPSFVLRQERVGLQVDESVVLVTIPAWGMGWLRFKK